MVLSFVRPTAALQRRLLQALSLLTLLALLAACGSPDTATETTNTDTAGETAAPAGGETAAASDGLVTVSQEQQATWVRNFNPFVADNRWPTLYGIHEPMMIYNTIKGEVTPWLATDYAWNDDNTELTFTLREGVKWSDGEAFDADDVVFTFTMFKEHSGLQGSAAAVWDYLGAVEKVDAKTVKFTFATLYTPGFYDIGMQNIVPEHVWAPIEDPLTYTNDNPVGTGPFTEVAVFQNQIWELHKNPNYWQPGKPQVQGLRFPSYPGNDQANLATINGENDWAGNFIPDIEKTYVSKSPDTNGYWFPATGNTVMLYANTVREPFDNPDVRKALSMCINREQIVTVAMFDYTHPADATGLSDAYERWRNPAAVAEGDWLAYDTTKANELFDSAGLTRDDSGTRAMPDGTPLVYDINVVSGWTDWVSAVQIIAQNLEDCGIKATVKTYDFSAWFERVQKGDYDLSIGWSNGGATPFNFYRGQMSEQTLEPVGEIAGENWQRFTSERADELLAEFATVSDFEKQKAIADELQMEFATQAPAIPLFPGPQWYEYNTTRFTGFPTKDDPYSIGSTYANERLLVLTSIKSR